jgi:CO/xanthine dehydrogenase Mo-binding subunit
MPSCEAKPEFFKRFPCYVVGVAIAKGRITAVDARQAHAAPGVLTIMTAQNAGKPGKGDRTPRRCPPVPRSWKVIDDAVDSP